MTVFLGIFLSGSLFTFLFMAGLFFYARRIEKPGIVDPAWAALIALFGLYAAAFAGGYPLRCFLAAVMAVFWGLRLSFYILFCKVIGRPEDGRYLQLMADWGENRDKKLFEFYMWQALAAVIFAVPFIIICMNSAGPLRAVEWLGFLLWIAAVTGETAADMQLEIYKRTAVDKSKTCRAGLWRYSRHPNYFFEFLHWCAVAVFALGSPGGFFALGCPALIFYFLFKVTGIPKAEEQALRTRGEDYREYQRTTNKFFPGPPKGGL